MTHLSGASIDFDDCYVRRNFFEVPGPNASPRELFWRGLCPGGLLTGINKKYSREIR
ncbi:hypothetical protein KRR40_30185 [Niabella defluvii]|nr:hypothetical protein KRR40_30185 [Niabella sp. I65]